MSSLSTAIAHCACAEAEAIGMGWRIGCAIGRRDRGKEESCIRRSGEPRQHRGMAGQCGTKSLPDEERKMQVFVAGDLKMEIGI